MEVVLVTKLTIAMIVQTAHYHTATCAAGSCGRKCVTKEDAITSNGINCRCFCNRIAVTTQGGTLVVRDDEQHISLGGVHSWLTDTHGKTDSQQRKSQAVGHGVYQHDRFGVVDYRFVGIHEPAGLRGWVLGCSRTSRMKRLQYSLMRMSM